MAASTTPFKVELEAGKAYFWCSCGLSQKQPFCDGAHKGTTMRPLKFTAEKSETAWLCGCKATKAAPRCDGSHKALK